MQRHRRGKINILYFIPALILIGLLVSGIIFFGPSKMPITEKVVLISSQLSAEKLADFLLAEGLIWNKVDFLMEARSQHLDAFFEEGEYFLSSEMGVSTIVHRLKEHEVLRYKFVLPEGTSVAGMAKILSRTPLFSLENTASSTPFIKTEDFLGLALESKDKFRLSFNRENQTASLEGYLFPSTYALPRMSEEELIQFLLDTLEQQIDPTWLDRARKMGWSFHKVLTLASIIEKEAGVSREMPIISSVFHNRQQQGMKLESDPTVEYAIGDHHFPLTPEELGLDSPYNTYVYPGLPPGPICNPGLEAIEAALYPAETDLYFFVAKGDGTHLFASTYEEHLANIESLDRN